jgi:site-specific DNA recombinase
MKSWITRKGTRHEGGHWDKAAIRRLLTNVVYIGQIEFHGALYTGEHEPIVDAHMFNRAAAVLASHRGSNQQAFREPNGFLLRGLIRCCTCGSTMTTSPSKKKGKEFRYYKCSAVNHRGRAECPVRSVPAEAIERFVIERIQGLFQDPELLAAVVAELANDGHQTVALAQEQRHLEAEHNRLRAEAKHLLAALADQQAGDGLFIRERLGELDQRAGQIATRLEEIRTELISIEETTLTRADITTALALFVPVWDELHIAERARILRLLIERIDFDGVGRQIQIAFRPVGVRLLAGEAATMTGAAA